MARLYTFALLLVFMLFAAFILFVAEARAQSQTMERCSSRAEMQATLSERFGELSIGNGIIGGDPPKLLEVFVSQGGSWSVTITGVDDQSCMQASGMNWKAGPRHRDVRQ